ncbi:hypothetical protein TRIUR3_14978 [Triticum urartu]|uniref:Uncharacterized protein n=1 Tax=Triticum urartu TaxID=4572 RepID=M7ZZV7_TRIUA|nr:hypothetical protein TRIUR3_14978 [Triticum urartu]
MERLEDILSKKEACVKRSDLKEEKNAERFKLLMEATDKKFKLEERRTMIEERKAALKEKKMIVQSVCYQMLQWQKNELIAADNEAEVDVDAEENVDSVHNDGVDAVKEDVGSEKKGSLNDDRKEDVDSRMNEAALSDGDGAKDGVDTGKIGPPSNNNDGEVHEQGSGAGTAEKEGAIGTKQEHPKSADDMRGTCNVRLENNSSKEEAATENKEEHTDGVVDSRDDIGNLGNNLMDSSKVYSCTHDIWTSR